MQDRSNALLNSINQRLDLVLCQPNSSPLSANFSGLSNEFPIRRIIGAEEKSSSENYKTFRKQFHGHNNAYLFCDESFETCVLSVFNDSAPEGNAYAVHKCISTPATVERFIANCKVVGSTHVCVKEETDHIELKILVCDDTIQLKKSFSYSVNWNHTNVKPETQTQIARVGIIIVPQYI